MRPTIAVVTLLLLASVIAQGQRVQRNPRKEQLIREELAAIAPGSVEVFARGTNAMDKHDYPQAVACFREVASQAPAFTPALRRLGTSLVEMGQLDQGLPLLEKAIQIQRSPENLASLAEVLANPGEGKKASQTQLERAFTLVNEARSKYQGTDDPSYTSLSAEIALELNRRTEFNQVVESLIQEYPNAMSTHYFNAIRLAIDSKWVAAQDEIEKARRMGLPPEAAEAFLNSGVRTRARIWRWGHYGLYALAAWPVGLLILFAAGKMFSKLTLRFIESSDPNAHATEVENRLRRAYRALINVAGSYYYLSLPFVIFLVLAVTALIVYAFLEMGHIPIKIVLILVIGALVTVYKMVHSLFVKVSSIDPGRSMRQNEAPGLWNLAHDVAKDLGTRPLDDIRILPGTEMAVYERGTFRERRQDVSRRILIMGVGLLDGFGQTPFRAVLAHEYGHLSHRDTAGGDVALRVNQDMLKFAHAMAQAGQAVWWNIAFQFLRLYHFLFRRISHGATRLQEVLADCASARLYGAQPFQEGLSHVIRRQIEFNHAANLEINDALSSGRALQNLYTLPTTPDQKLEDEIKSALNRQTSEDDTHPSPNDRFRLVERVNCQNHVAPGGLMWDLIPNREAITLEMSSQVASMLKAVEA